MIDAYDRLTRELRLFGRVLLRSLPEFALLALLVVLPICLTCTALLMFGVWT